MYLLIINLMYDYMFLFVTCKYDVHTGRLVNNNIIYRQRSFAKIN